MKPEEAQAKDCLAPIWFLDELDLYRTVKPYRLRFSSPDPNIPRSNVQCKQTDNVLIRDFRSHSEQLSFEKNGFTFLEMKQPSLLTYEDCSDMQKIEELLLNNLQKELREFFGTAHVMLLSKTVCPHASC